MSWVAKSLVTLQILIGVYKEDMNSSNLTSPNYNYQKEKKKCFGFDEFIQSVIVL